MSKITMVELTTEEAKFWKLHKEAEATYLKRDDVFQRLRFSKEFALDVDKLNKEIEESNYRGITTLNLNSKSLIVNNPKNLNPCMVVPKNNKSDADFIILTISGKYKLVNYKLHDKVSIRCTFKNDKLSGAIIVYDAKKEGQIIDLVLSKGDKIYDVSYQFSKGRVRYSMFQRKTVDNKKVNKTGIDFMFDMDIPVTEAYITTSNHVEHVQKYVAASKLIKKKIVVIDGDPTTEKNKLLISELKDKGYRAITQYGVKLPYDIIKENKFQYVFILDKTNKIKSIKSN